MSKAIIFALVVAYSVIGCGVEEEPPRPRIEKSKGPSLASMSLEERKAATAKYDDDAAKYFVRPDGQSGGDAVADNRACRESLLEDQSYVNSNQLVQLVTIVNCMKDKGWEVNEEASPAMAKAFGD